MDEFCEDVNKGCARVSQPKLHNSIRSANTAFTHNGPHSFESLSCSSGFVQF